jgi:sigma-B regulation protein RsbU (phosphoserine phosphatase)
LALAAKIQRRLLPPQDGSTTNWQLSYYYQPAQLVSGDYCDYFSSDRDFLFLCGDVSGKGVAASMLMSHLHATFRSLADSDLPLSRMVEAANRIFLESTLANQFATLGRALDNGSVELVSAGHLPVLHLHQNGAIAQEATGTPLGMFSNARFPAHTLHLRAGESLLIYTDGLTEARDAEGNEYGMERVKDSAFTYRDREPGPLVTACVENLERFKSGGKQTDDLTIMAVRRLS